jgi:hypothetical protein
MMFMCVLDGCWGCSIHVIYLVCFFFNINVSCANRNCSLHVPFVFEHPGMPLGSISAKLKKIDTNLSLFVGLELMNGSPTVVRYGTRLQRWVSLRSVFRVH